MIIDTLSASDDVAIFAVRGLRRYCHHHLNILNNKYSWFKKSVDHISWLGSVVNCEPCRRETRGPVIKSRRWVLSRSKFSSSTTSITPNSPSSTAGRRRQRGTWCKKPRSLAKSVWTRTNRRVLLFVLLKAVVCVYGCVCAYINFFLNAYCICVTPYRANSFEQVTARQSSCVPASTREYASI